MAIRALIFIFFLCFFSETFSSDRDLFIAEKIVNEISYFKGDDLKKIKIKKFSSGSDVTIFEARGKAARSSRFCYVKYVGFEARKTDQDIVIDSESTDEGFELYFSSCSSLKGDKVFFSKGVDLSNAKKVFNILKVIRYKGNGCTVLKSGKYDFGRAVNINNSRVVVEDVNNFKVSLLSEQVEGSWLEVLIEGDLNSPKVSCFMPI